MITFCQLKYKSRVEMGYMLITSMLPVIWPLLIDFDIPLLFVHHINYPFLGWGFMFRCKERPLSHPWIEHRSLLFFCWLLLFPFGNLTILLYIGKGFQISSPVCVYICLVSSKYEVFRIIYAKVTWEKGRIITLRYLFPFSPNVMDMLGPFIFLGMVLSSWERSALNMHRC